MNTRSVAVLSAVLCLASAVVRAAGEKAVLVGSPAIVLEAYGTSGAAAVDLRNDMTEAVTLHLSVSPAQDAGQGAMLAIEGQSANSVVFDLTIGPRATGRVRITLSGAGADDFDVDLLDGATRIAKLPVKHKAFSVHVTDPKATVSLREGEPTDIRVSNDDRESHDLQWRLRVQGRDVCNGRTVIQAKSSGLLTCRPAFDWGFLTSLGTLFRPVSVADASLIVDGVGGAPAGTASAQPPLAVANVAVSANAFDTALQQGMNYGVVVLFLVFGGVTSLVLSQLVPNRLTRLGVKERLDELHRTISGLGVHTDSSLRVLLRVERSRLVDLLRSRAVHSPEFAAIATQCSQGIDRLKRRTMLVQQLELTLRRIGDAEATTRVSWTQSAQARASAARAQDLLRNATPTDADFVAAETAIVEAAQPLADAAGTDNDFQAAVLARVTGLKKELTVWSADSEFVRVIGVAPQPAAFVESATADTLATSAIAVDRAAAKLQLMFDYLRHARGVTGKEKRALMLKAEVKFLDLLQNSNVASIHEAAIVLQQIRDGIYVESLLQPLRQGEARVLVDPSVAYEGVPLQFSISFFEPAIERAAAARSAYKCVWDFGDELTEESWEVTHYFLTRTGPGFEPREFKVTATFIDEHGKLVTKGDGTTVELIKMVQARPRRSLSAFGERSAVELFKLGAALLIAVFGLVAGARDQIAKLDVFPALVAVFLLGFGADTIKSLLSSKS